MKATALALVLACAAPIAAGAQDTASASPDLAAAAQTGGPMIVERLHTTFVVAPDAKYSRFDHKDAWLAGAYGGVLLDEQWLVGVGGYGLTNGGRDRGLWYVGGVFGWMPGGDRAVTLSARVLLGGGEARLTDTYADYFPIVLAGMTQVTNPQTGRPMPMVPTLRPINYSVRFRETVFVAEPQVDAALRIAPWGRLTAGVGYRAIATDRYRGDYYDYYGQPTGDTGHRLRGATASVSLQLGRF